MRIESFSKNTFSKALRILIRLNLKGKEYFFDIIEFHLLIG